MCSKSSQWLLPHTIEAQQRAACGRHVGGATAVLPARRLTSCFACRARLPALSRYSDHFPGPFLDRQGLWKMSKPGLCEAAAAINELRDSLEDDTVSEVTVEGATALFTVQTADGSRYAFTASFGDRGTTLRCTSGTVRGLAKANSKLAACGTLQRAVAAAGRCVAADLDWVCETLEEAGGCYAIDKLSLLVWGGGRW